MTSKKLLEEICSEDGCTKNSCFLKELMLHNGLSDRQAMQLKLIDKFKYEWSEQQGRDIGWDSAFKQWIDIGYAKQYSDFWKQDEHTHHVTSMYHALKRYNR